MLVGERPLAQAVKSFERADPITLPFISPGSKFDPGNLIGRLRKRFLKGLLLVKCAMILAKPVLPFTPNAVKEVNKILRKFCRQNEWGFIDHNNITTDQHLNRSRLHLNRSGTSLLSQNFISYINGP